MPEFFNNKKKSPKNDNKHKMGILGNIWKKKKIENVWFQVYYFIFDMSKPNNYSFEKVIYLYKSSYSFLILLSLTMGEEL
jgi:hypothetical protein